MTVALQGKWVLADDWVKNIEMGRSYWIIWLGPVYSQGSLQGEAEKVKWWWKQRGIWRFYVLGWLWRQKSLQAKECRCHGRSGKEGNKFSLQHQLSKKKTLKNRMREWDGERKNHHSILFSKPSAWVFRPELLEKNIFLTECKIKSKNNITMRLFLQLSSKEKRQEKCNQECLKSVMEGN